MCIPVSRNPILAFPFRTSSAIKRESARVREVALPSSSPGPQTMRGLCLYLHVFSGCTSQICMITPSQSFKNLLCSFCAAIQFQRMLSNLSKFSLFPSWKHIHSSVFHNVYIFSMLLCLSLPRSVSPLGPFACFVHWGWEGSLSSAAVFFFHTAGPAQHVNVS